jgi:hypothetical protein
MKRTGYVAAGVTALILSGFGIASGQDRPAMPQGRMMDWDALFPRSRLLGLRAGCRGLCGAIGFTF